MKKLFTLVAVALASLVSLQAQEEAPASNWTKKNVSGINLSQTSLSNWAAGGENSVSWNVYLNSIANYKKDKWSWDNGLVADFGQTYTSSNKWQKSVDKLNLNTKAGYALSKHWNAALLLDFLTQFDLGYKSAASRAAGDKYISKFLSPGYVTLALGADYKPNQNFSLLLSPATGKLTIVADDYLSSIGAYGVAPGKHLLAEIGASVVANYNTNLTKDISLVTKLTLFSAYNHNFGNVDVNWDLMLNFKVNKYITANFTTNLVYDDDIKSASGGPKVQLRQMLGLGAVYTF
ncbi:MAG: DUF3078 domain-containing protein [Porphyromonas sp.]|nr:DUF3078 domain-containing protein [Porphyromonas sp.]